MLRANTPPGGCHGLGAADREEPENQAGRVKASRRPWREIGKRVGMVYNWRGDLAGLFWSGRWVT